jgi:hypothetical protein
MSGFMGMIGQGMAFGTGSAVAHQAVGAAVNAVSGGGGDDLQKTPDPPRQQETILHEDPCEADIAAFNRCLKQNDNQLSHCQFFFDAYQSCKQSGQQTGF